MLNNLNRKSSIWMMNFLKGLFKSYSCRNIIWDRLKRSQKRRNTTKKSVKVQEEKVGGICRVEAVKHLKWDSSPTKYQILVANSHNFSWKECWVLLTIVTNLRTDIFWNDLIRVWWVLNMTAWIKLGFILLRFSTLLRSIFSGIWVSESVVQHCLSVFLLSIANKSHIFDWEPETLS